MKSLYPLAVFFIGSGAVIVFFMYGKPYFDLSDGELGALFTGVGLAGIVATLVHQRAESAEQNRKHEKQIDILARQAEAACVGAELTALQTYLAALRPNEHDFPAKARCDVLIERLKQINPQVR